MTGTRYPAKYSVFLVFAHSAFFHFKKIILVNRGKKGNVDHNGVVLRLVGVIQVEGRDGQDDFLDSSLKLLPATNGEALIPDHPIELGFSFGALGLPFDSYEGQRVTVRYYLELQMKRSFSDVHKERTLWVIGHQQQSKLPIDSSPNPISMEIGLTVFLHIQINLTRTVLPKDGIVEGSVLFLLVGTEIREARLQLIRREILVSEEQEAVSLGPKEGQILGSHQIMHGLAQRGDRIPFRFLLATTDVGPTKVAVGGVFSIRYYLMVTFHDQEDRKYFKSQEIMINKETTAKIIA